MSQFQEKIDKASQAVAALHSDAETADGLLREAGLLVRLVLDGTDLDSVPEGTVLFGTLRRQLNFLRLRIEELRTGVPWQTQLNKED